MSWIKSLARIIGTTNPITGMAVQFADEIDGRRIQERLRRLEDPISALHPDVGEVSELLFQIMSDTDSAKIELSAEQYDRYARVLAVLEGAGMITGSHSLMQRYFAGLRLSNPSYVLYMAGLFEDPDLMERFVDRADKAQRNSWLHGDQLAAEFALPLPVVRAVFQLMEAKGLGFLSKTIGTTNYYVLA